MKKVVYILVCFAVLFNLAACNFEESVEVSDIVIDEINAKRGNLLHSLDKLLNGKYDANIHIIRKHNIEVNSPVIQDYDIKYSYLIDDKREAIKHICCDSIICNDIMDIISNVPDDFK